MVRQCTRQSVHVNLIHWICTLGVTTILFFQCMAALFDPTNRTERRGIKWWLVVHTTAMFSLATIGTAMGLNLQSISRIDNRAFPGGGQFSPGPLGYKQLVFNKAISIIPNLVFPLTQWLADGLLVRLVLNQVSWASHAFTATALPLLHYLCRKLLGYCLSMLDVSRLPRYALECSAPMMVLSADVSI